MNRVPCNPLVIVSPWVRNLRKTNLPSKAKSGSDKSVKCGSKSATEMKIAELD